MAPTERGRISSGIPGLDEILRGGFIDNRTYTIRGTAGTGKTILGYHFLTAGVEAGETTLYLSFEETVPDLESNAEALGFDISDVIVEDLSPSATEFLDDGNYTVFGPAEVEAQPIVSRIGDAIDDHDPERVFIDPLSLLRHLVPDDYQFKRTAASLLSYLKQRGATTLFTSQVSRSRPDEDLQYLADGSITLTRSDYGRKIAVDKFRGSDFHSGPHGLRIDAGEGITVFRRLIPEDYGRESTHELISSGNEELDKLLGGGIEQGSITLVSGPSGIGKSTTGTAFGRAAAMRDEPATAYLFEESEDSFTHRSEAIGLGVTDVDQFNVETVEPLSVSADEFATRVRRDVEERDTRFVMIDGTAGYRIALQDPADNLRTELHALCRYLRNMDVTVVLTDEIATVTGQFQASDSHVSYLADNVLFIRYIEIGGEIQKAIGVLKKRFGPFESSLREFSIGSDGLTVGDRLEQLRGVLTGTPSWDDSS